MFKIILLRPILWNATRSFSTAIQPKSAAPTFGDPRMPDKLYKTIELEMKSAEPAVLKSYQTFIKSVARELGIETGKDWSLKKARRKRWDLLKSVHIYRKHMVQYEVRTHYSWMQLHKMTGSTADTFLEYIERMLPEGVALKVTRVSIQPMPQHISEEIELKEHGENKTEGKAKVLSDYQSEEVKEVKAEETKEVNMNDNVEKKET